MIPFEDLPSNTPDSAHRSASRLDPYWDGLWERGATANWVSREHLSRMERGGIAGLRPKHLATDPTVAMERIYESWQAKLDLLSVLANWRTVTAEQYAAFAGRLLGTRGSKRVLGDFFALDLIDYGSLWVGSGNYGRNASRGRMIRPANTHAFDRIIRPRMSYAEWVSVTAGRDFMTGGQYDRHNLLTNELVLRIAEHHQIGTALGERQSILNDLAFTSVGMDVPPDFVRSQQVGDGVIVRPDGVRIVIETTATWNASCDRKAEAWARAMARRPFDETGIIVVFVVADHPEYQTRGSVANQTRLSVNRLARHLVPGSVSSRTADRMFVVDWRDWFPTRGEASIDYLDLVAKRPSGPNGEWEAASLLSDVPTPAGSANLSPVVHAASGLRLVPHQLREGRTPPRLGAYPMRKLGMTQIPQLLLDPRTGAPRDRVGRAWGHRGEVQPPPRMRFSTTSRVPQREKAAGGDRSADS